MQELSLPTSMAIAGLEGVVGDGLASETQVDKQRIWTFHGVEIGKPKRPPTITSAHNHAHNN
jgi:hypothetical protein